jgi:hypothetical protein
MSTKKQLSKIARQKQDIRNQVWPDLDKNRLWWGDKDRPGWLLIPRTMPLLTRIMDMLAPKGKPVSQTYLDLWCRTYDDSFVIVSKPREMAYYSGFSGERAERTWATRMRLLQELGFIDIKAGTNGPIHYVLVWNPYHVVKGSYEKGLVQEGAFNALNERVIEIGAEDLDDPISEDDEARKPTATKIRPVRRRRRATASAHAERI